MNINKLQEDFRKGVDIVIDDFNTRQVISALLKDCLDKQLEKE